ncbi:CoA ester lyase [Sphaerisporangium siamense]|uniref:Citrate lyase subunit beta/citryl-CoA lyase n=1 Tax=Sphaerisporangium siamense TaxID=795645 RepID=A0A7W7DDF4_9ACTN|nr:CoA ester lyase [Sphaerisporangium siamense]MBB4704509.1 citrate lyase subunit beta/citryl-CoA lyase [Sphaerisporangium siamense]GII86121.1 CoA ester lyase [Sphaerisporangium siamense]
MTARSYLYVPGDAPGKLGKALGRGADALIVDLEDAVPAAGKDAARAAVRGWLETADPGPVEIWIRVNAGETREADVRAVAGSPKVAGLVLAKVETAGELTGVDALLTGIGAGDLPVVPLLESAAAVLRAQEIAAAPRVARIQVGEADLRADTGITPGDDERELLWVRSQVVLASAAAGIDPPVAPVSTDFRDLDALRASTRALARLGYVGRACIHPAQIAVVNEVFTPAEDEVRWATDIVTRFEAAGSGVLLDAAGRMVDEAVVRQARRVLARAS